MIDANPAHLSGPDLLVHVASVEALAACAREDAAKVVNFNDAKAARDQRKMRRLARRTAPTVQPE